MLIDMEKIAYIDTHQGVKRRVLVEDGIPVELAYEEEGTPNTLGNIYIGRVEKVLKGMDAAFVQIGQVKNAFLPLLDIPPILQEMDAKHCKSASIAQGQDIIVQITKDAVGDKGARITMNVTFPGKLCVLLPTVQAVGVSKQIQDTLMREILLSAAKQACPEGMGLLIRTAAQSASTEEIIEEAQTLLKTWTKLIAHAYMQKAPALLVYGGNLLETAARDINAKVLLEPLPAQLNNKLSKALHRKVWMDSGAYLIIDTCEAMTVIDVNSGKYTGKKSLQDTAVKLNCEAAREVAYQIRLRDMGGIIVVDFVDMQNDQDRIMVLNVFGEALNRDRAKRHIHGFTSAGLFELTRRSIHQPNGATMGKQCPCCGGTGVIHQ